MKAIISHDIDHITVWEHIFRDTIIPRYMLRMHIELASGKIALREYLLRWSDLFRNKWQNVDELITFNNINGVPSSFFIAVNRGGGLNYSRESALLWMGQMKSRDCEIGLHGIFSGTMPGAAEERGRFLKMTGLAECGIRMHYFSRNKQNQEILSGAGYKYDSTLHGFMNPFRVGKMWEFPVQIRDARIIKNYRSWQTIDLVQARAETIRLIEKAHEAGLSYLCIDYHDRYFSNSFRTWLEWYMWLVEYLRANHIEFINFDGAIRELESGAASLET